MPLLGFEPTAPAFKRTKTVDVLDRVATAIGPGPSTKFEFEKHMLYIYINEIWRLHTTV
jgi:hypothetical protein